MTRGMGMESPPDGDVISHIPSSTTGDRLSLHEREPSNESFDLSFDVENASVS